MSTRKAKTQMSTEETKGLTELIKILTEERKCREEREAEAAREREERIMEETRRRDEREAMVRQQMLEQMELLQRLIERSEESRHGSERIALAPRIISESEPKVAKLTEDDDVEAYLTTFERVMTAHGVPKERWTVKLAPQLTGKAQQAYAAMATREADDYDELKKVILRRYDIRGETYRRRFRSARRGPNETFCELKIRLDDLMGKWSKECTTVEVLKDLFVME